MSEQIPPGQGGAVAGHRLADYLIEHELGRGGMAVVYLARDPRLDRPVALKVLSPELARDEAFRRRFIQESRAAAAVDHPNIIPVFDAGEADGVLYLAMRYVPGGDVRSLLDRAGPLPVRQACSLVGQVASALDAAHERGLIHRDVKPTNMLLEPSSSHSRPDHVYLADFGLAKQSVAATSLTMTGQFLGTVDYVAPEQIEGHALDGRADQYALACAVFEMLCGYPPFRREHAMAVISAQLSEPPPWLSALRPGVPAEIDQVLAQAMAKAPDERYARCVDFAEALLAASGPEAAGGAMPGAEMPGAQMPGAQMPGAAPPRPRTELASPAGLGAQAGAQALDATAPVPGAVPPDGTAPGAGPGGPAQPPGGDQPTREFPGIDPSAPPDWWDDVSAPVPGPAAPSRPGGPPRPGGPQAAAGLGGRQFPPGQIGRPYPARPGG
ncbi:MAG: protein kinase, partial [Nocardiopsaceae bacterium]|nr:protein kinase [Nocardiopsaceae bacterium]